MTNKFIEQRVDALENELSELKLIVEQLRKPSTVVQEEIDKVEWLRGEIEGVIEFGGQHYKKVDREARKDDVVIFRENTSGVSSINIPYKVINDKHKATFLGDIGNVYLVYDKVFKRTRETVDVYELIVQDAQRQTVECPRREPRIPEGLLKSANQLRAEIIEKAKGFVDSHFKKHWNCSGDLVVAKGGLLYDVRFVIKKKEKQVNALLRLYGAKDRPHVDINGKALCNPSDVFNEHIGKAIALGRALVLDVSEFEQAVQPNEYVKGQVVKVYESDGKIHVEGELVGVESQRTLNFSGESYRKYIGRTCLRTSLPDSWKATIINDTNAIYGVLSNV